MPNHAKGLLFALLAFAGCGDAHLLLPPGANLRVVIAGNIQFMTMAREQAVGMQALFVGRLKVDDNGCVRLDSPDDATVIWPHGYTLTVASGAEWVGDDSGRTIGLLDGEFSLGGGEVTHLHSGMGFSSAEDSYVASHCPGRYWIVNGG